MQKLDSKSIWVFFLKNLSASIVLAIIMFSSISSYVGLIEDLSSASTVAMAAGIVIVIAVLLDFFIAWLMYRSYSYELGEDAFKRESGVIIRRSTTIPYERIQNVDIIRGLFSRLIGLSDIHVQTAGGSSYAGLSEGRLPALSKENAIKLQTELLVRAKGQQRKASEV